ncbi:ATPase [Methanoculleus taiwanensis]|uniref:ATPase n=1 Tax=Methanoculleus taiwanensis TaxID=1550565 RepID=A0A498H5H7_9EURY|nr:cation-transporting P-type ATPase [Methanoculleus taiwanensis]RXE56996.1 ATPase [Methanoculleus taiwanensis]
MLIYSRPKEEVLSHLNTREEGLRGSEVDTRLKTTGYNEVEKAKRKNYVLEYAKQYTSFFAVLLEVAALLSFIANVYSPGEGYDILGVAVLGAVIVNATFTFWQEYKAERTVEALLKLIPPQVSVRRNGAVERVDARMIVPGDILILEEGDRIAADAVVLEANSLYADMATLTGESRPVKRTSEPGEAKRLLESRNVVFAGTTVVSGNGVAAVFATGTATEFGKIAKLSKEVTKRPTPMQREIVRITRILTLAALLAGAIFFILGFLSGRGLFVAAIFALSLIVANVPEGMLPTITLSLSLGSQRMAGRNALVKNLDAVQTLGSATVICTDKTGTLTRNEMTARHIYLTSGEEITITGEGYSQKGDFSFRQAVQGSEERLRFFLASGLLDCRATIGENAIFGDPTELAIVAAARKADIKVSDYEKVGEIPFSSDRKMMSTIYRRGSRQFIFTKGAPEVILEKSGYYLDEDNEVRILTAEMRDRLLSRAEEFEKEAYRVLTVAYKEGDDESGLICLGLVAFMDLPRAEVPGAVDACRRAGVRVMILTGDSPFTAMAIAETIGLSVDRAIVGDEILDYSDDELGDLLKAQDILFARMPSDQKLRITGILQRNGEVVAMTGDGVNDAPALRKADIGVAMGERGTEVAKEAADIILLDDNFASIVAAIEEGRTVYYNIKKFVTYILSSNMPEIIPYILQFFLAIPLPLSVIQILSIDLGTDLLPGLSLGKEQPEEDIMDRPPVGKNEQILDREVFKRGYAFLGMIEATAAMTGFLGFLFLSGWQYGDLSISGTTLHYQAMTMTLLGAVFCQIANVWTLRSWQFPLFSRSFFSNRLLLAAVGFEVLWVALLLLFPPVQFIFNTAFVPPEYLLLLVPFPILLLVAHEYYKARIRRREARNRGMTGA